MGHENSMQNIDFFIFQQELLLIISHFEGWFQPVLYTTYVIYPNFLEEIKIK